MESVRWNWVWLFLVIAVAPARAMPAGWGFTWPSLASCRAWLAGPPAPEPVVPRAPLGVSVDDVELVVDASLPSDVLVLSNGAILNGVSRPQHFYEAQYFQVGPPLSLGGGQGFSVPLIARTEPARFKSGLGYGPEDRWPGQPEYDEYMKLYLGRVLQRPDETLPLLQPGLDAAFRRMMIEDGFFRKVHDEIGDWRFQRDPYFDRVAKALYEGGQIAAVQAPLALVQLLQREFPAVSRVERPYRERFLFALSEAAGQQRPLYAYSRYLPTRFETRDGYWFTFHHRWSVEGKLKEGRVHIGKVRLEDVNGFTGYNSFLSNFSCGHRELKEVRYRPGENPADWRSPQEILDFLYWNHRQAWPENLR